MRIGISCFADEVKEEVIDMGIVHQRGWEANIEVFSLQKHVDVMIGLYHEILRKRLCKSGARQCNTLVGHLHASAPERVAL